MYPDWAFWEFYPAEIVEKVLRENPDATVKQLNCLMRAEWDAVNSKRISMAELADELGL